METVVFRIAQAAQRRAAVVFVIVGAITVFLGYFAFRITLSPDILAILPETATALRFAAETGQDFSAEYIVLAAESREPLRRDRLQALHRAIREIEGIPHVRASFSPFNFFVFQADGRRVVPGTLGPRGEAPDTPEEMEVFVRRITTDPLARNMVISEDGTTLATLLAVDALDDYGELLEGIHKAARHLDGLYTVHIAGSPSLIQASNLYLKRDVPLLLLGAIGVVLAVFFFGFGSKRGFLLPFLVVGLGTLWTTGIMSLAGLHLTLVSLMVPPLVLVLGSSYSIHVVTQYYRDSTTDVPNADWIPASVTRIVQTVFLAAGTTVFGFLGLLTADIRQIKEFGISASIGITLCALLALFFFPPVLSMLKPPARKLRERVESGPVARMMRRAGAWVLKWRWALILAVAAIVAGFAVTLRTVRYNTNYMSYFRAKEPAVEQTQFVIRKLGGYLTVRITLTAPEGQAGHFLDPAVLERVAGLEDQLEASPDVTYVSSFTRYLKAYNEALTGTYGIPTGRAPILALSRLFRAAMGSPEVRELVGEMADDAFTRLTLVVRVWDSRRQSLMYEEALGAFAEEAKATAERVMGPGYTPVVWGPTLVGVEVSEQLARDQVSSTIISTILILALTSLSFRSVRYGFYTILSTGAGICLNFLIMAVLRIPLDLVTIMFTSVSMGVGVDSSIHVIIQYRRQRAAGLDSTTVLRNTLSIAGQPVMLTVASLVAGLLVMLASSFVPIARFGFLVSLAIFTTSAGSLLFLPAVLAVELKLAERRT